MAPEEVPDSVFEQIEPGILQEIGDPVPVTFAATVVYIPVLLVSLLLCLFWVKSLPERGHTWGSILLDLSLGVLVGFSLVALTFFLARYLRSLRELELEFKKVLGPLSLSKIIYLALLSGITEEICFRGFMQPWLGYLATSILFGMLHFVPVKIFIPWTLFALAVGFIFGGLLELRGSLLAPMVAHVLVNGINLHLIVSGRRLRPATGEIERPSLELSSAAQDAGQAQASRPT